MSFMDYDLSKVVKEDHPLWQAARLISFERLAYRIKDCTSETGRKGYGLVVALKCLFLQFRCDLSDRQLEEQLRYNIAYRWFCGFNLDDDTPDHSFLHRMRKAIGEKRIGKLLKLINNKARAAGMVGDVFTFVDSSAIKAKETTWAERDRAKNGGIEKLNNQNIDKFSADKDARYGCKGKNKYWFGHKRHVSADMRQGLILEARVTAANVPDHKALGLICPPGGMVFGDKGYSSKSVREVMAQNGCHSGVILKNNAKEKNKDKDCWLTKVRAPFENIFSKNEKKARYRGTAKVQLQVYFEAIIHNTKRLIKVNCQPLFGAA